MNAIASRLLDEFRYRVELYERWDLHLAPCTRFFGAAAATNALLVKLCTGFRFGVSQVTLDFLACAGTELQDLNVEIAHSITSGAPADGPLDHSLIETEQSALELKLRRLARDDDNTHELIIRQIDRLLHCVRIVPFAPGCLNLQLYSHALRGVESELGRLPTFAAQDDRVCIGLHLVRCLRRHGGFAQPRRRKN